MKKLYLFFAMTLIALSSYGQGVTSASMSGMVMDESGQGLIGASVVATHTPTGTVYGTITDSDGSYNLSNMKVGGPYTLIISYIGYTDNQLPSFNLALGEKKRVNTTLLEGGVILDELMIVASAGSAGTSSGTSTQISEQDIINMPTLGRDLKDFTRLTPQARESFDGGISLAGQNNRYNAIYIDGAVNNDVFGLATNGQNGGQTGIAPFSIDAVDQIQVVLSPYDVSYGGFAGGGINAVTKSGTNEFKGSAYYFLQNESLAGKTNGTLLERIDSEEGEKLDDFSNSLIGASLGGPIIKDKLFFFVNAEIQKDETPVPFAIEEYEGDTNEAGLTELSNFLRDEYGYEAGQFGSKVDALDGTRIFGKLNYNINKDHNISLRHQYTKGELNNVNGSNRSNINFENNGVFFPTTTNSTAVELSSSFGTKYSNNLIVGYTTVKDDRDPIGQDFPNVRIDDGDGRIFFGSEAFSTANALDQKILTITDNFKMYKGDHTITIGTHNEIISFYNLFIRQNFGAYRFGSIDDFYAGNAYNYDRSYSLVDDITGDGSAAAAEFGAAQFGIYIQDEWNVNSKFTLTGGLRLDMPVLGDDPDIDAEFNTTTLPLLAAQYNLEGAEGGQSPSGQLMISPRLGANYQISDKTTIRGGLGIFTSRVPFAWPGGMYVNNGVTIGGLDERDLDGSDVAFISDPQAQYTNPNATIPSGQVDLFAKDFKFPQVFRTSLAVDQEFGQGWNVTVEGMYTKTLNNVLYQNVNSASEVDYNWTNGGDTRPIYTGGRIDDTYTAVYLGTNTSEGYAYNLTAQLEKVFNNGLNISLAYSVGDGASIFEGTSSQNSSQWRGAFSVDGRNNAAYGRSDFALGSRVIAGAGYQIDWTGNGLFNTTLSMFYNGQSGELFSYVYNNDNISNESGSTNRERDLIYVPTGQDDIALIDNGDVSAQEQWEMLDKFITEDSYLSSRRGEYAEKNSNRTPFVHTVDIRILQDLGVNIGGKSNKLQLSIDIFNFGNMINNKWGTQFGNPFAYRILNYQGVASDGTTPQFTFTESDLGNERFAINDLTARWRARVGLRYIFN